MNKVKIGLIGTGSMGQVHLLNCMKIKNAEITGVADKSKISLKIAKNLGIKNIYTNYEELIKNKEVDAVIISLPNFLHCECATLAAEANKHVFIEKPLARNVEECEKICSCINNTKVKAMVGYPLRFDPKYIELKKNIDDGMLGSILMASFTNIASGPFSSRGQFGRPAPVPSWWFDKELLGGGALLDLGIHSINLFRYYFGEIIDVQSQLGYRFNLDLEDHAVCSIKFRSGTLATIRVGWFSLDLIRSLELNGTSKNLIYTQSSPKKLIIVKNDVKKKLGMSSDETSFYRELKYFIDCISSDIQPVPSVDDGLSDVKVVAEAYRKALRI
jgi:predicted dehydrogenase